MFYAVFRQAGKLTALEMTAQNLEHIDAVVKDKTGEAVPDWMGLTASSSEDALERAVEMRFAPKSLAATHG